MRCRISGRLCRRWNTTTRNVVLLIPWCRAHPPSRARGSGLKPSGDLRGRQRQVGSLAGAAHLLNDNTGVLRSAQWEQKSHVEQKGKSWLDFDFQYEYKPGNRGLSILSVFRIWSERCQKSYHRWASFLLLSLWHYMCLPSTWEVWLVLYIALVLT